MGLGVLAVSCLLTGTAALAQEAEERSISNPVWVVGPPRAALPYPFSTRDYRAAVSLECRVAGDRLTECFAVGEALPANFVGAALLAAESARLAPRDGEGQFTEGRPISVDIRFPGLPIPVAVDPPPAPPAANVLTSANVEWLERPDAARISLLYPPEAFREGQSGQAVLDCIVDAQGQLACAVLSEEPAGLGFGEAAIRASRLFRMAPETRDGHRTAGGRVRIPIRFSFAPPAAPPSPPK